MAATTSILGEGARALILKGFVQACATGRHSIAQQIVGSFEVAEWCVPHIFEWALDAACESGNPELISWLITEFKPVVRTAHLLVAIGSGQPGAVRALLRACSLEVVRGTLLAQSDTFENEPLQRACAGGNLEIVHLLMGFGLTEADVRSCDDAPLIAAARGGHTAIIVWLLNKYRAAVVTICASLLRILAHRGHLEALQALIEQYEIDRSDAPAADMLRGACLGGHLEVAAYLIGAFKVTPEELGLAALIPQILGRDHIALVLFLMCHYRGSPL